MKSLKSSKELIKEIKILKKELEKAKFLTDYDELTGVYNRRGFIREAEKFINELRQEVKKSGKQKRHFVLGNFAVIFVDLDGLKKINDKYGHKAGDKYIKTCAKVFKNNLRDLDIVARWGGDEFVMGFLGTNEKEAVKIAEKLRIKINNIKIKEIPKDGFSASFGVVAVVGRNHKINNIYKFISKADAAMYKAKKEMGKNFVISYSKFKK